MSQPVIFDACTLINLLRVDDEDDEFLYKHITALNLHIAEKVHSEVRKNYKKIHLADNQVRYIDRCLVKLYNDLLSQKRIHKNEEIINDLTKPFFDNITEYGGKRYNKDNGELYSTALGLVLSRIEGDKVCFYTDDEPATKQFTPYFYYQQIGTIMDTVDLLLYLYWKNSDFEKQRLKNYLRDIFSDINQPLKTIVDKIQKIRDAFSNKELRNKNLVQAVNNLIGSYYNMDVTLMDMSIQTITKSYRQSPMATLLSSNVELLKLCPLASKISLVKSNLDKFDIYKL